MKIDLTCPVELWHYALPTQQYPVCRLQLFNLTEQPVSSIQAAFACYDAQGVLLSRQVERVQGLSGEGRSAFEMAVEIEEGAQAAGLDFSIEKVWFADGTVWRHASGNTSDYVPNALPVGRRLDVLRYLAGPDALGFPSDQGAVWMCVCGRPNSAGEDMCRRCGRNKREVFTSFNEAVVETVIFEHENAMEEKARRERAETQRIAQEQEEARLKKQRRRRRITLAVTLTVLAAVLAFGVTFHGIPFYRYYTACRQLENGVYTTARTQFEQLAAQQGKRSLPIKIDAINLDIDLFDIRLYESSAELAQECTYRQAMEMMNTGTITAIRNAQDAFDGLGAYRDSKELALHTRYLRAERLLSTGQYEAAIALFNEVSSYADAAERSKNASYQWAQSLMDALDYSGARAKFLGLGKYEDAAYQADLCLYKPALKALEEDDFLGAIELLEQLDKNFEKTSARLQESYYCQGNVLFDLGQYDEAAEYYLLAGDYLDAYSQATACLYEPARDLFEAGEYAQAKEMFDKIPGYRDAQEMSAKCCVGLAEIAMETEDYAAARAHLQEAGEYEPALELLQECTYIPAVALQEAGDLDGAYALLETIPEYKDVADRLNEINYTKAIEMMNARQYESAITAFDALGDYRESADEALNARYGLALQQLENGQYQQAIERLTALNDFQASKEHLKKAQYLLGKELFDNGDVLGAAACFAQAGDYEDAQERHAACTYSLGQQAIEQGDNEAAAKHFAQIPDYQDADMLRMEAIYRTAEQMQEAGQLAEAAELFQSIEDHEDAHERAEACYDAYYQESYNTAKQALKEKDYAGAVRALQSVERENMSDKYSDIDDMYNEANYYYANELYEDKKPYEALKYYRNIEGYRDVAKKLDRVCYRILGSWTSVTGTKMVFREDGTCTIDGRDYYFHATTYAFSVGDQPDELNQKWTIYSCQGKNMSLQNNKTKAQYKLKRD